MADAPAAPAVSGTVKLPGIGPVSKKTLAIGALVAGGVLAYAYIRKARGGAPAAPGTAAAAQSATDPNLDPNAGSAGLGFGSGTGLGGGEFFDPNTGQFDLASPFTGGTTAAVTTNAQWEQEAIGDLEAGGVSQHVISNAESGLPRYLAHLTLSDGQATAVQMAVGLAGPPPQGGPFSIRRGGPPPPKPKPAEVTVPRVTGRQYMAAAAELTAHGLHARRAEPDVGLVVLQNPAAGARVRKGSEVVLSGKAGR